MKANTESERESKELNNKIVVCLGKGGQRDMAESFSRKTGAPIVDKPGEYLTIHFDSQRSFFIGVRSDLSGRLCGDDDAQSDQRKTAA